MRSFHKRGTIWNKLNNIVETPLYVDSSLTSMVQIADLCSYALRRFFEKGETELLDRIYPRIDRNKNRTVGVRHFSTPSCNCRICSDHAGFIGSDLFST